MKDTVIASELFLNTIVGCKTFSLMENIFTNGILFVPFMHIFN